LECVILLVTMSVVAVAAGVGLQAVAKVPTQSDEHLVINSELIDRMEQMRATAWDSMAAKATSLSGNVTVGTRTHACTVSAVSADADGGGVDTDFRTITVTIGTQSMSLYVTKP
jgi:hypothetical protein